MGRGMPATPGEFLLFCFTHSSPVPSFYTQKNETQGSISYHSPINAPSCQMHLLFPKHSRLSCDFAPSHTLFSESGLRACSLPRISLSLSSQVLLVRHVSVLTSPLKSLLQCPGRGHSFCLPESHSTLFEFHFLC